LSTRSSPGGRFRPLGRGAAQRSGDSFKVSGTIPVTFSDYNIPNPSFGPVTTEDHGEIEFLLAVTRT
jgi:hypothetical protein